MKKADLRHVGHLKERNCKDPGWGNPPSRGFIPGGWLQPEPFQLPPPPLSMTRQGAMCYRFSCRGRKNPEKSAGM